MNFSRIFAIIIFIICVAVILMIYLRAKKTSTKIISSVLMGILIATIAYFFLPNDNYDLVRHWEVVNRFKDVESFDAFLRVSNSCDLEVLPQVYSFVIAKIGDYHLLPAILALLGYSPLFYMMIDYKNRIKIPTFKFIGVMLVMIFGQHMLFYFSGLYNYFAINMFAFAIYMDYVVGKRIFPWIVYLLSPFMHISMLLPLALMIIAKLMKNKITLRFVAIFALFFALFSWIMNYTIDITNIEFLSAVKATFDSYVAHNTSLMSLYDGFYLYMSVTKIGLAVLACYSIRKNNQYGNLSLYIYFLAAIVIVLSVSSIAITRLSSLILFISLPIIMDVVNDGIKKERTSLWPFAIYILGVSYAIYTIMVITPFIQLGGF